MHIFNVGLKSHIIIFQAAKTAASHLLYFQEPKAVAKYVVKFFVLYLNNVCKHKQ